MKPQHYTSWKTTALHPSHNFSTSPKQIFSTVTLTRFGSSECDLQHSGLSHLLSLSLALPLSFSLYSISLPMCRRCPLLNLSKCQTENSTLHPSMTWGVKSFFKVDIKKIPMIRTVYEGNHNWIKKKKKRTTKKLHFVEKLYRFFSYMIWTTLCFSPFCRLNKKPSYHLLKTMQFFSTV